MGLFVETPGRERNPLGGKEAADFDRWLMVAAANAEEAREALSGRLSPGNPMDYVANSAARHYGQVLTDWQDVKAGRSKHVRDDLARDQFEVSLIAAVMSAYGAAEYARERGYKAGDTTNGGRPVADVSAEYLRACIILAQYVGVSEMDVHACEGDQAALMALRADVRGCSCGMADYGAPGHDGDPQVGEKH